MKIKIYGWLREIFRTLCQRVGLYDPVSLVAYEHVIVTVDILKKIEEKLL